MSVVNEMVNTLLENKATDNYASPSLANFLPVNQSGNKALAIVLSALVIMTVFLTYWFFVNDNSVSSPSYNRNISSIKKTQEVPLLSYEIIHNSTTKTPSQKLATRLEQTPESMPIIPIQLTSIPVQEKLDSNLLSQPIRKTSKIKPQEQSQSATQIQSRTQSGSQIQSRNLPQKTLVKTLVKTTSRTTIAKKHLANLVSQWDFMDEKNRLLKIESLFSNYGDQPKIWLQALSFLKSNGISFFSQFMSLALLQYPKNYEFISLSARYQFEIGNYSQSLKLVQSIPNNKMQLINHQLLALLYQKRGQHQKAIVSYQRLLLNQPLRGDINMAIGISYETLNQQQNAVKYFLIALNDNKLSKLQKAFVKQRLVAYQG
jgi:hypothetical protein